jgi:hypothetical protein
VLSGADKILSKVKEIMNDIPAEDISETELVIKITHSNIPTFEYIDLPGDAYLSFQYGRQDPQCCEQISRRA